MRRWDRGLSRSKGFGNLRMIMEFRTKGIATWGFGPFSLLGEIMWAVLHNVDVLQGVFKYLCKTAGRLVVSQREACCLSNSFPADM